MQVIFDVYVLQILYAAIFHHRLVELPGPVLALLQIRKTLLIRIFCIYKQLTRFEGSFLF